MKSKGNFKYLYSINELMTLTGKSFRTLKKRLSGVNPYQDDGNGGIIYDLREVFPLINRSEAPKSSNDFRVMRDKSEARLAAAKAQKLKLEVDLMKRKLIPLESAEKNWAAMVSACRSRILTLPSRAAIILRDLEAAEDIEAALMELIHEVLNELSANGAGTGGELAASLQTVCASAEAEAE